MNAVFGSHSIECVGGSRLARGVRKAALPRWIGPATSLDLVSNSRRGKLGERPGRREGPAMRIRSGFARAGGSIIPGAFGANAEPAARACMRIAQPDFHETARETAAERGASLEPTPGAAARGGRMGMSSLIFLALTIFSSPNFASGGTTRARVVERVHALRKLR